MSDLLYNLSDIKNEAIKAYEKEPSPYTLKPLLAQAIDNLSIPAAARITVVRGEESLAQWDSDLESTVQRYHNYNKVINAMTGGKESLSDICKYFHLLDKSGKPDIDQVPDFYTNHVEKPFLYGSYPSVKWSPPNWSKSPTWGDYAQPFSLANQIAEVPAASKNFKGILSSLENFVIDYIKVNQLPQIISPIKKEVKDLIDQETEDISIKFKDLVDEKLPKVYETSKRGAKAGTKGPIILAIALGGLALYVSSKK